MAWRLSKEALFRFDPGKPVSRSEIGIVENAFTAKRQDLERTLSADFAELRRTLADEGRARAELSARYDLLAPAYARAVANSRAALLYS